MTHCVLSGSACPLEGQTLDFLGRAFILIARREEVMTPWQVFESKKMNP